MGYRRGAHSWRQAVRDYRRLCAVDDPATAAHNRVSAAQVFRDALPHAPQYEEILRIIAKYEPVPVRFIRAKMSGLMVGVSTIPTQLGNLYEDGMVEYVHQSLPGGRARYLYRLSPLGRLVLNASATHP